jgi:PadR family transcriptional regulator
MGDTRKASVEPSTFLPGTLDMLILKTVSRGAMHGYAIAQFIQQASRDVLKVEEGALYPALHRLEVRGLLAADWDISANNRRAKYYRLTPAGRKRLKETRESWRRTSVAINRVLEAT